MGQREAVTPDVSKHSRAGDRPVTNWSTSREREKGGHRDYRYQGNWQDQGNYYFFISVHLNTAEREIDQLQTDLRVERERRVATGITDTRETDKIKVTTTLLYQSTKHSRAGDRPVTDWSTSREGERVATGITNTKETGKIKVTTTLLYQST